ncbi:MAG: MupA/Atu3671 family FMN-dependent luciferase-like monooxygenase [Gemmatimonadota bacterium]
MTCFVTSNHALRRWAEERQMRVMDVSSDWVAALRDASLDYLFSVADPHVLSSAARQCARRGSIGVHDGPLRRHAGIAGPAWSITDGAREHCVSWRRLDEAADAGVMLFQRVFPVAANEDAGVLRARCIEAGAETFAELLDDLESEFVAERGVPPDRATMHGAADRPAGRSVISWRTSAADVDALVQALDHGTYANPVAVPTVYTSKGVFVVLEFEVLPGDRPTAAPGTLVAVDAAGWVVSTATADVRIGGFHEVDGTALTPARVAELARVAPGDVLPVPPADAIARIDAVSRRIHRHEAWWVGRLASLAPLRVPASGTAGPDAGSGHDRIASVPVGLEWSRASTGSGTPDDHLAAAVLAYLARVTGHTTFDIGWRDQATADTVAGVECWFAPVVPVHVALTPESDAEAAISAAFDGVRVARERTSYSRTVAVRYPALRQAPVAPLPVVVESVNALARSASAPLGDLTVTVCAPEQVVRFRSRDGRYTARDLERLTSGFLAFVQAMARAPHQALATLPVMDETEARRVLREWNATAVNVPPACIHQLIEAQVRRTPDAIALHALDGSVTYRELDRRANRLARLLQQAGVGPDQPVGLCLPRTSELVIAVVAIHKAGGAYVPLDPSYPAERVRYMLEDSGAAVLVTTAALAAQFPDYAGRVVSVESLRGAATERDDTDIAGGARPEHLAYRIYTSGSTGLPKGVDVEHRNVVNFFAGMDARIGGGGPGTWLAVTSLSFDISVLELCWTLARGFTVVLADDAHAGAQAGTHSGGADGTTHAGRGIDFSLFYFSADEHEHAREKYRLLLEGARFADRNGFVAVWTPERHFHAFGGLYPNPSVTGAAIAAITERVQIRAGSCVLPLHHPLRVVEEWSVVDNLSGGRVGVSFAAGWQPNDFVLRPEGYATAKERFLEDIDTVRRLWRGESLPFTAPNGQTVELRTLPRPIQPTLPAWYTTAGNPESYTAAGRAGLNLLTHLLGQSLEELRGKIALYREAWREAGHPGRGHVSLMLHAFVGDDEAQVKETVREPLTAYLRTSVGLVKQYADTFPALKKRVDGTTSDLDLAALAPAEMEALLAYSFERYYETSGLFGTPERAAGMVDRVKGADVDEIACLIDFGIESARVLAHLAHLDRLRQLTGAPAAAPPAAPVPELDDLTALPLRRAFREAAERVLDARRTTERPVSLLVMDIDHFKLVNDCFGHQQGDDALRMVATLLQQAARRSDFIARYAGDELVALLPGSTLEDAVAMAEHLRAGVECASCPRRDGSPDPVRVTLSIGVASAPTHGQSFDELFAAADGALYAAKRRGRNAVAMASATTGSPEAALLLDGFIGRHAERQRRRRLLEVAANGAPRVVAVVGEAGIGKSTLLRQLGPEIGVRAGALLVGRCLEADVRPPYGPWADVIGAIHALGLVPLRPWRELGRLVPALGAPADRPETPVAASAARYTLMHEIEEYLTRAATARPLVIVLDDMHWGDRETWDVLELLVPRLSGQRLLLCLALRREDVPADVAQRMSRLSRHECVSELTLGRLSHDELEHWLRSALGGRPLDSALLDHVADHTEGNPLFAVQSLQMLLEEEVLSFDDGAWRYRPQAEQPMPTAVRELLTRRLARLSDATREVLTAAAIVGTRFDADLLLATTTRDEGTVLEALDEGVRVQVLTSGAPDSPTTYEFTHGLLADVLRRSGNPLRMRRMHERVARLLAARPTSAPADIATHFDQAGCGPEALSQAVCAADRAMSVYAYDAAATCLTLASRHTVTPVEHADVVWRQAMLDETVGRYEKAERHCEALLTEHGAGATAIGVTRKARRMVQRLRLLRGASAAEVGISCQQLYEAALAADDHAESVALLMMLSQVHGRLGNDAEAERTASTAVSVARSLGDTALLADAIMREGSAMLTTAPADTVRHYRQALDLFTQRHDRRGQLRCQINIGVACDRAGNHPAAELAYASALDIGREVQAADLTALASMNLGVLLMKLGRFTEASQRFEDTLRSASAAHHEPHRLGALYNLAHLARERGDPAGATERYGAAIRLARQLGQLDIHVGATCGIGLAELALGRLASARAQLQAAQSILDGRPQWFQGRELFVALGVRLQLAAGATDNAVRTLCDTLAVADGFDSYAAVWLAAECAAAVRAVGGPPDRWHAVNARYTVHARALGYAPLLDRLAGTTPEHRMPEGGLADGEAPSGRFAA